MSLHFSIDIDVFQALHSSGQLITVFLLFAYPESLALLEALDGIQQYVHAGKPLSEAFNLSGVFPSLVVRMLKVGEESGNLTSVLDQVSEFYTNDVDEAIQGLISMIEPMLTALLGGMIMWIAVAVFGPIYSSFEKMQF